MQDQKKSLSIFSFSKKQLRFLLMCGIFFLPIIALYIMVEMKVSEIPNRFSVIRDYIKKDGDKIEIAVFGSSQIQNGINPEFLNKPTINLGSLGQHHNTDFTLLKGLKNRFPNLKTVVFEASYGHFEIPHNSKYYWKNSVFLKYYHVNTFGRPVTPKDSLLFISHPGKFSKIISDYYLKTAEINRVNQYGFDTLNFEGKYKKQNYDSLSIIKKPIKIYKRESLETFHYNANYFYNMIDYCIEQNLQVIILSPPTQSHYNVLRNNSILKRRNRVLSQVKETHNNIHLLNLETDLSFTIKDFKNENHLNPNGAKKLTIKLDSLINTIEK